MLGKTVATTVVRRSTTNPSGRIGTGTLEAVPVDTMSASLMRPANQIRRPWSNIPAARSRGNSCSSSARSYRGRSASSVFHRRSASVPILASLIGCVWGGLTGCEEDQRQNEHDMRDDKCSFICRSSFWQATRSRHQSRRAQPEPGSTLLASVFDGVPAPGVLLPSAKTLCPSGQTTGRSLSTTQGFSFIASRESSSCSWDLLLVGDTRELKGVYRSQADPGI